MIFRCKSCNLYFRCRGCKYPCFYCDKCVSDGWNNIKDNDKVPLSVKVCNTESASIAEVVAYEL